MSNRDWPTKLKNQIKQLNNGVSCLVRVESSSSSGVFFQLKFIERLQFSYPRITDNTWINLWALLCGVFIVCRWENRVHLPFESLSNLQIDKQSKQQAIDSWSKQANTNEQTKKILNTMGYKYWRTQRVFLVWKEKTTNVLHKPRIWIVSNFCKQFPPAIQ